MYVTCSEKIQPLAKQSAQIQSQSMRKTTNCYRAMIVTTFEWNFRGKYSFHNINNVLHMLH